MPPAMFIEPDAAPEPCRHGVLGRPCGRCEIDNAEALIVAVLVVAGFLFAGGWAGDREAANERERLREHQQRLERAEPGARQRLDDLAAEQRRK